MKMLTNLNKILRTIVLINQVNNIVKKNKDEKVKQSKKRGKDV